MQTQAYPQPFIIVPQMQGGQNGSQNGEYYMSRLSQFSLIRTGLKQFLIL